MADGGRLLFLILILVISLIPSSKKRKTQGQPMDSSESREMDMPESSRRGANNHTDKDEMGPTQGRTIDDVLKEVFPEVQRKGIPPQATETPVRKMFEEGVPSTLRPQDAGTGSNSAAITCVNSGRKGRAVSTGKLDSAHNKAHQKENGAKSDIGNIGSCDEDMASGGIAIDDFDIRKAIVYSEILKPKYEEY